jgi:hypothetical protein
MQRTVVQKQNKNNEVTSRHRLVVVRLLDLLGPTKACFGLRCFAGLLFCWLAGWLAHPRHQGTVLAG